MNERQDKSLHFGTIAQGKNVPGGAAQVLIHNDAAIDVQSGGRRQLGGRAQAYCRKQQFCAVDYALIIGKAGFTALRFDKDNSALQVKTDADAFQSRTQECGGLRRQQTSQRLRREIEYLDLEPRRAQIVGEFAADQSCAE